MKKNEIWIIRHTETKEHWKAKSGKTSWKKSGHAKNAWANTYHSDYRITDELKPFYTGKSRYNSLYFNEQDLYECVDISEEYITSKEEITEGKEAIRILEEVREMLYGQGFEVSGWHMNGDLEPLDNFFEENNWI